MATQMDWMPPIMIGSRFRPAGKGPHDDPEIRVAYSLVNLPETLSHLSGVELVAFWVTRTPDGWRLTLKGRRGDKYLVAYMHESEFRDILIAGVSTVDTARCSWQPDKRPIRS